MKKPIMTLGIATMFAIGTVTMSGCGSPEQNNETEEHEHAEGKMHEHQVDEMEGHDHEAMETEMSDMEIPQCPKWKDGEHQHAAFVCPMWEEEGESEKAGECPKCGMELVEFAGVKAKHDMQQHVEHNGHEH